MLLDPKLHIRSAFHAKALVLAGILMSVTYKIGKYLLWSEFKIDPTDDYYEWQFYCTVYRILGAVFGFMLIRWAYSNFEREIKLGNPTLFTINLLLIIPLLFVLRAHYFDYTIVPIHFYWELFFNSFTGLFEEAAFRGMLFAGLAYFTGISRAAFISSFIFSIWHLDTTTNINSLLIIFILGMFDSYSYYLGASLMSLSLFHFLWDQVVLGIDWNPISNISENFNPVLAITLAMTFVVLWLNSKKLEKMRKRSD